MKKTMTLTAAALCVMAVLTARAADPDYVWREQLRALVTTNAGTAEAVTNVEIASTVDCLDSVIPAFKPAWTNATVAVTVSGGDAVVTNATLTLTTNLIYDSTGAACSNAAGESVYVVTWCVPALETGAITATSALTPETGDFVSGITSNVVTPMNSISFETDTFVTP